jgi:hypothetical protein
MPESLTIETQISLKRICDLLCCALEGGSNYWYRIEEFHAPEGEVKRFAFPDEGGEVFRHLDYPLNEGGYLIIRDCEGSGILEKNEPKNCMKLDLEAIKKGAALFVNDKRWAHHYRNFIQENEDAETGDVFLQLCVFGDCIYG